MTALNYFPLGTLSFFNLQNGRPGVFVASFLLAAGWKESRIGQVRFIAGMVKMVTQMMIGPLIDESEYKRSILIIGNVLTSCSCLWIYLKWIEGFWTMAICIVLQGIGESLCFPSLYGITLGIIDKNTLNAQVSLQEMMSHSGNFFYSMAAGLLCWYATSNSSESSSAEMEIDSTFFLVVAFMGCAAVFLTLNIDAASIDQSKARGETINTTKANDTTESTMKGDVHMPSSIITAVLSSDSSSSTNSISSSTHVDAVFGFFLGQGRGNGNSSVDSGNSAGAGRDKNNEDISPLTPGSDGSPAPPGESMRIPVFVAAFFVCICLFHM